MSLMRLKDKVLPISATKAIREPRLDQPMAFWIDKRHDGCFLQNQFVGRCDTSAILLSCSGSSLAVAIS